MALHTTAITPATSVLKIRIFGDSGSGRVSTLPRGTIIGTQPGFPQNYDDRYHEPMTIWYKIIESNQLLVKINLYN